MARTRDTQATSGDGLNLLPVMNLIVCLIPMVLAGTSLVQMGVIDVSAPRFCETGCGETAHTPALNLTVAVGKDGFRLEATGASIADLLAREAAPGPHIALTASGRPNYPALYGALAAVKSQHPEEHGFTLTADESVSYAEVVNVMDVARMKLEGRDFESAAALRAAPVAHDAEGRAESLLPNVVLAVAR